MGKETIKQLQEEINNQGEKRGAHPDSIEENLYKEDIEIVRLHYDKASKFATFGNASFGPLLAATIALREGLGFRFWLFLIWSLFCLGWLLVWNKKMNKCFNTLNKKIINNKELNTSHKYVKKSSKI